MVNHSDALIVQNLIIGNNAGCGGGIYWGVPSGSRGPILINNTIADNNSNRGSAIFADGFDAQTELINNVIVAKAGQTAIFCGGFNDRNSPILRFNDIFSPQGTAYGGICADQTGINGNISADPMFVDPVAGNYHLQTGSPCIDACTNEGAPTEDIEGNPRPIDGDGDGVEVVDMGAFESGGEVCNDANYARGNSSVRFKGGNKDKTTLRLCVDQAFCDALKAGPEEIVLELVPC